MVLLKHCRFMDWEIDKVCFRASMSSVMESLARQVLNDKSDIKGS